MVVTVTSAFSLMDFLDIKVLFFFPLEAILKLDYSEDLVGV